MVGGDDQEEQAGQAKGNRSSEGVSNESHLPGGILDGKTVDSLKRTSGGRIANLGTEVGIRSDERVDVPEAFVPML